MSAQEDLFDYVNDEIVDAFLAPDHSCARFLISGELAVYPVRIWTRNLLAQLQITLPIRIPEGARRDVAEAICGINYAETIGGFELDFRDGDIRFVVTTFLEEDRLPKSVWNNLMGAGISTVERFAPAIFSMVYGNESPREALTTIGFYDESE